MGVIPLAVYARAPLPGVAKTRLAPALGPDGAATLYAAFIDDTLATCVRVAEVSPSVWVAGDPDEPSVAGRCGTLPRSRQAEGDLGARMGATLDEQIQSHRAGIVIGSDSPTLPAAYLGRAAALLAAGAAVVLGPSADGGYYLVGACGCVPPILDGVRWSSPHTLADTVRACRNARIEPRFLPPWYDVDTPEDLRLLRAHLAVRPRAAPATARSLGLF
jgi:hypothetical protein